jgi:uncharacterized lipoprotein
MKAACGCLLSTLLLLAACGRPPNPPQPASADSEDVAAPIAPAMIPPEEFADPKEPPSYEVAIATAAADRNKAIERCHAQPQAVRTQCEQEANAAFGDAQKQLEDLRGNQQ